MATELTLYLRNGVARKVRFEDDETWELKDTDRLVLVLDGYRQPRHVVNLADFVDMAVAITGQDGDAG